jgi:Undecaprenyl-phosphate glucose phosphotransferase
VGANFLYVSSFGGVADFWRFGATGSLMAAILVPLVQIQGNYTLESVLEPGKFVRRFFPLWLFVMLLFVFFLFAAKISSDLSRLTFGIMAICTPLLVYLSRLCVARFAATALQNDTLRRRRVYVLCRGPMPSATAGLDVVGTALIDLSEKKLDLREVVRAIRVSSAEEVILSLSWTDRREFNAVMAGLRNLPLPVKLLADGLIAELLKSPLSQIGSSVAVEVQRAPLSNVECFIKRGLDLILSTLALVILGPFLAVIAGFIKLDSSGPVIFRQRRTGFNGRCFTIYKFKTMTTIEDGAVVVQATRNDGRVTRLGKLLRRYSVDELPQLVNVLRGEMSLVGPRPHAIAHDDQYSEGIARYAFRQHVKPGITGWSQVNGLRGETCNAGDMQRRVALDLWYIDHWSIWLDLWILLRTLKAVVLARNAY